MADRDITSVLARLRATHGGCTLADLDNLVPDALRSMDDWIPHFVRHPLVTLIEWGLIEAHQGFLQLTGAEVLKIARDRSLTEIRFSMSRTATRIEQAFGHNLWDPQISIFGEPRGGTWPDIFVLMPFADELAPVFHDHIKPLAAAANFTVARADDFFSSDAVIEDIWNGIYHAQAVIADCTHRNPNVFYEIGIAHAVGKKTILIAQTIDDVPFDLRHLRVLVYEFTPRGMSAFENSLRTRLEDVRRPQFFPST